MSDFPYGGSPEITRQWLDANGFNNYFLGWKADGLLGLDKLEDIELVVPRNEALRLHGLLNYARRALPSIQGIQILFSSFITITLCFI